MRAKNAKKTSTTLMRAGGLNFENKYSNIFQGARRARNVQKANVIPYDRRGIKQPKQIQQSIPREPEGAKT